MKNYEWSRTDTAAIMFCAIKTYRESRIYRVDVVLKDEEVDPEILKKAVELATKRLPQFLFTAQRGFFWAHLKKTNIKPTVREETLRPGEMRNIGLDGHPEFEVLYYKRRISVEGSHELADGTGYCELLKTILAEYFYLKGVPAEEMEGIRTHLTNPEAEEWENAAARYATNESVPDTKPIDAYFLDLKDKGNIINFSGIMDFEAAKKRATEERVTLTAYYVAALLLATINISNEPIRKTISTSVPVNVRSFFPSKTTRNFTSEVRVHFNPNGRTDWTIGEICDGIRGSIAAKATKETMQAFINKTYAMTQNNVLAAVPYFIKKPVISASNLKQHSNEMTHNISNVGQFTLPPVIAEKIERAELVCGDPDIYGMPVFTGVVSVNNKICVSLTQSHDDRRFVKEFFRILASDNVPVRVETSDTPCTENTTSEAKHCTECGIETAPEYGCCPLCGGTITECDALVKGIKTTPYPADFKAPAHPMPRPEIRFTKEFMKAYFMMK